LLAATIAGLVEGGASGATTAEIERRAGVSRGARLHHYPTKAGLLAAAVEHLYRGLRESFESQIKAHMQRGEHGHGRPGAVAETGADRFAVAFRLLWSNFLDARYGAVLELSMLARTDAELRASLHPVAQQHHDNMRRRLDAYFPTQHDAVAGLNPPLIMESIHAAMQGLALRRVVFGEDITEAQVLEMVEQMARSWIQARVQGLEET